MIFCTFSLLRGILFNVYGQDNTSLQIDKKTCRVNYFLLKLCRNELGSFHQHSIKLFLKKIIKSVGLFIYFCHVNSG